MIDLEVRKQMPHYVYEFYAADGTCLYIGCTLNLGRRFLAHVYKPWWSEVAAINVDTYPDWTAGSSAERSLIEAHNPIHNDALTDHAAKRGAQTRRAHKRKENCGSIACPWHGPILLAEAQAQ